MENQHYKLNPYAQIIEYNDKYVVYQAPNYTMETASLEIEHTNSGKVGILHELIEGNEILIEQLSPVFEKYEIELLIKNKILICKDVDVNTVLSRTNMFYQQYLSTRQREMLYSSKVLILGCGGIGSTIAWQIAVMGVSDITIVDFDEIEKSNLNRIPMFSISDIGLKKVNVVSRKLKDLFPAINITSVDKRISSEQDLERICKYKQYDLIIKALDSPIQFPVWFDSVCKRNHYKYISGVTLRDRTLIGPTFIPDYAEVGYSDIMNIPLDANKVFGTIPSIGLMLFHATDEMAIEAFKILIGENEKLKYCQKICAENIQTGEKSYFQNKVSKFDWEPPFKKGTLLDILCVSLSCLCVYKIKKLLFPVIILSVILPFICYNFSRNIIKLEFINAVVIGIMITVILYSNMFAAETNFAIVSTIGFVTISIISILYCFIGHIAIELYKLVHQLKK